MSLIGANRSPPRRLRFRGLRGKQIKQTLCRATRLNNKPGNDKAEPVTQFDRDPLQRRLLLSTRPATASSFLRSFLSRASGAVISAASSARSDPTGHASC